MYILCLLYYKHKSTSQCHNTGRYYKLPECTPLFCARWEPINWDIKQIFWIELIWCKGIFYQIFHVSWYFYYKLINRKFWTIRAEWFKSFINHLCYNRVWSDPRKRKGRVTWNTEQTNRHMWQQCSNIFHPRKRIAEEICLGGSAPLDPLEYAPKLGPLFQSHLWIKF